MTCFAGVPRDEAAAALDLLRARLHQDRRLDGDAHQDGHHRHVDHTGQAAAGETECPKSGVPGFENIVNAPVKYFACDISQPKTHYFGYPL